MAILFQDLFQDAANTPLNAHSPNTDIGGSGWTHANGAWKIDSTGLNAVATGSSPGGAGWIATFDQGTPDGILTCNCTPHQSQAFTAGPLFRWSDNEVCWWAGYNRLANALRLYKRISNSWDEIASANVFKDGVIEIQVELSGSNIKVYADGSLEIEVNDPYNETATRHGLRVGELVSVFHDILFDSNPPISTFSPAWAANATGVVE